MDKELELASTWAGGIFEIPTYLPSIKQIVDSSIPAHEIGGLYFLIDNDVVVYVGQGIDLHNRYGRHRASKKYNRVAFMEILDPTVRSCLESLYIKILQPKYNKTCFSCDFTHEQLERYIMIMNSRLPNVIDHSPSR